MKNSYSAAIDKKSQIFIFILSSIAWLVFIQSTFVQTNLWWYEYLLIGRIFMLCLALLFGILTFKRPINNLASTYFIICASIQSTFAVLEPKNEIEYYEYVPYFILLAGLAYNGKEKDWYKNYLIVILTILIAPLFFKEFGQNSIGSFVFHYTMTLVVMFINIFVIRINSTKFVALTENIKLNQKILNEEKIRNQLVNSELNKVKSDLILATQQAAKITIAKQVAHDIRSPLSCLDTIARRSNSLDKKEASLIIKSVERINEIAEDLLSKNRQKQNIPDKSNQDLHISLQNIEASHSRMEKVNISDLVNETIEHKSIEHSDKNNIKIKAIVEPEITNLKVPLEPKSFKRMLSNLVNNAVEAISPNSRGFISASLSKEDDQIILEIRDNGKGISEDNLNLILERGQSIGKEKGNGLGVLYAKQVVNNLNGQLRILSKLGLGTTVSISLPTQKV